MTAPTGTIVRGSTLAGSSCSLVATLLAVLVSAGCSGMRPELVDPSARARSTVEARALELTADAETERERAVRIYDFVRDHIEYGFTRRFDEADPAFTLEARRGHCNPQTELLVALMQAAGLEARQRFVTIDPDILDGLFPKRAPAIEELNHSFAEVRLDGEWIRIDGYAVDRELWSGARAELELEGRIAGYGVHRDSCTEWNGESDCMAQFVDPAWQRRLWEPIEPARQFYATDGYTQRMGRLVGFFYRTFGVRSMNAKLDALRREGNDTASLPGD